MNVPLNPFVNFVLIIGGYVLSGSFLVIAYFLKRRDSQIDKELGRLEAKYDTQMDRISSKYDQQLSLLSSREETRWTTYTDKHALLSGRVDVLQDNYTNTMEYIRRDISDIKAQAGFIPVMKNELENLRRLLEDGFGHRTPGH